MARVMSTEQDAWIVNLHIIPNMETSIKKLSLYTLTNLTRLSTHARNASGQASPVAHAGIP